MVEPEKSLSECLTSHGKNEPTEGWMGSIIASNNFKVQSNELLVPVFLLSMAGGASYVALFFIKENL